MYQYKNYSISENKSTDGWTVWGPNGSMYGPFATDTEAEEFVDEKEGEEA